MDLPIDVTVLASLRETARLVSTHYSTKIEGNRLTQAQVREVVAGARFPGKERDELEVRHHYRALEEMERLAAEGKPLTEMQLRRLHGLVMTGQSKPTPYRDGQNVIRNSLSREIVYKLPPGARRSGCDGIPGFFLRGDGGCVQRRATASGKGLAHGARRTGRDSCESWIHGKDDCWNCSGDTGQPRRGKSPSTLDWPKGPLWACVAPG